MNRRSLSIVASVVLGVLGLGSTTMAVPTYEIIHEGNSNPQDEGWRGIDIVASTQTEFSLPRAGVGAITDGGVEAWQIDDGPTIPSDTTAYWASGIGSGRTLADNYWKFTVRVKALPSDGSGNSRLNSAFQVMAYTQTYFGTALGLAWRITMEDLPGDGTRILADGNTGNPVDLMVDDGYHWLDLIYVPGQRATLYVDGQLVQSDVRYRSISPAGNRVEFGDLILVNGGDGGGNWAYAYFGYDENEPFSPTVIPEPASLTLLSLCGLGLIGRKY